MDHQKSHHPCHNLSDPAKELFSCRHCKVIFSNAIDRWHHSKKCLSKVNPKKNVMQLVALDRQKSYHPCHNLSDPAKELFSCRHCMATFANAIDRWHHSKNCSSIGKINPKRNVAVMKWLETSMIDKYTGKQESVAKYKPNYDLVCRICCKHFKTAKAMRNHVVNPCSKPQAVDIENAEAREQNIRNGNKVCMDKTVVQTESLAAHADWLHVQSAMDPSKSVVCADAKMVYSEFMKAPSTEPFVESKDNSNSYLNQCTKQNCAPKTFSEHIPACGIGSTPLYINNTLQVGPYTSQVESMFHKDSPISDSKGFSHPIQNGNKVGSNKLRSILEAADFLNSGSTKPVEMHVSTGSEPTCQFLDSFSATGNKGSITSDIPTVEQHKIVYDGNTVTRAHNDLYANLSSISDAADLLQFSSQEFIPKVEENALNSTSGKNSHTVAGGHVDNLGEPHGQTKFNTGQPSVISTQLGTGKPGSMQTTSNSYGVEPCSVSNPTAFEDNSHVSQSIPIVDNTMHNVFSRAQNESVILKDEIEGLKMLIEAANTQQFTTVAGSADARQPETLSSSSLLLEQSKNILTAIDPNCPHHLSSLRATGMSSAPNSQQASVNESLTPQMSVSSTTPVSYNVDGKECNEYVIQLPNISITDDSHSNVICIPGHLFDHQTQQLIILQNDDPGIDQQLLSGSGILTEQNLIILQDKLEKVN
ncbi:hypothetical protein ScPMuIL_015546 [Solemya velum]